MSERTVCRLVGLDGSIERELLCGGVPRAVQVPYGFPGQRHWRFTSYVDPQPVFDEVTGELRYVLYYESVEEQS